MIRINTEREVWGFEFDSGKVLYVEAKPLTIFPIISNVGEENDKRTDTKGVDESFESFDE